MMAAEQAARARLATLLDGLAVGAVESLARCEYAVATGLVRMAAAVAAKAASAAAPAAAAEVGRLAEIAGGLASSAAALAAKKKAVAPGLVRMAAAVITRIVLQLRAPEEYAVARPGRVMTAAEQAERARLATLLDGLAVGAVESLARCECSVAAGLVRMAAAVAAKAASAAAPAAAAEVGRLAEVAGGLAASAAALAAEKKAVAPGLVRMAAAVITRIVSQLRAPEETSNLEQRALAILEGALKNGQLTSALDNVLDVNVEAVSLEQRALATLETALKNGRLPSALDNVLDVDVESLSLEQRALVILRAALRDGRLESALDDAQDVGAWSLQERVRGALHKALGDGRLPGAFKSVTQVDRLDRLRDRMRRSLSDMADNDRLKTVLLGAPHAHESLQARARKALEKALLDGRLRSSLKDATGDASVDLLRAKMKRTLSDMAANDRLKPALMSATNSEASLRARARKAFDRALRDGCLKSALKTAVPVNKMDSLRERLKSTLSEMSESDRLKPALLEATGAGVRLKARALKALEKALKNESLQGALKEATKGAAIDSLRMRAQTSLASMADGGSLQASITAVKSGTHPQAGWLRKRGPTIDYSWKRIWCVLESTSLVYYTDESLATKKGSIELSPVTMAVSFCKQSAPGEAQKHRTEIPFGFVLDPKGVDGGKDRFLYYFDAEKQENLDRWLRSFERLVQGKPRTSQRLSKILA
eukprot:TRINITY_DN12355_c0_g1_i1.p1 TRINITY_DN12355_c0_g1~~TRINITY_DN12355_c0_g1_i1.p1  ORF type:complete len:761 (-),score=151.85 TRINITY_DN12355_c0_g1_i1:19-2157(-)